MNKKQFIHGRLVFYENFLPGGDEKTATFATLREQLNKLETDEDYIKFVRSLDVRVVILKKDFVRNTIFHLRVG